MFDQTKKAGCLVLAGFLAWGTLVPAQALNVFPNPVRPSRGQTEVVFDELAPNSKITIFTIMGVLVRELHAGAGPLFRWDMKNDDGTDVASGVYVYLIESGGGTATGKLAVIR